MKTKTDYYKLLGNFIFVTITYLSFTTNDITLNRKSPLDKIKTINLDKERESFFSLKNKIVLDLKHRSLIALYKKNFEKMEFYIDYEGKLIGYNVTFNWKKEFLDNKELFSENKKLLRSTLFGSVILSK
uniref:hypothetical protein n=1 Tax=Cryptomonas gyropyrenoidosa TaxID=233257 RepID=UPI00279F8430|nr:hypothetical protein QLP26_pgp032 [Cryptomonas gyropyrenoidosa]WFQ83050.1 hypothetical protein [Cryptomonas gyropyrenoidosa]